MNNRWKKFLMLGLSVIIGTGCLAGCGRSGSSAESEETSVSTEASSVSSNVDDGSETDPSASAKSGTVTTDTSVEKEEQKQTEEEEARLAEEKAEQEQKEKSKKLQKALKESLDNNETAGNWAAYVYCLDSEAQAAAGSTEKMQAASLIKLFIFGTAAENWDTVVSMSSSEDEAYDLMKKMITVSDNTAANTLITRIGEGSSDAGKDAVNAFCEKHEFSATHLGRLLLESNDVDDNYTSAEDCARIIRLAYTGDLKKGQKLLEYMTQQERTNKIPEGIPDGIVTGNKTGELDDVENDAAIIWADEEPYILCVMSENLSDTYAARIGIANVSADVYNSVTSL